MTAGMKDSGVQAWWRNKRSFIGLDEQRLEINGITGDKNRRTEHRPQDRKMSMIRLARTGQSGTLIRRITRSNKHQVWLIGPHEGVDRKVRQMWQAGHDSILPPEVCLPGQRTFRGGDQTDRTLDRTGHGRTNRTIGADTTKGQRDRPTGQDRTNGMMEQAGAGPGTNRTTSENNTKQNHNNKTDLT